MKFIVSIISLLIFLTGASPGRAQILSDTTRIQTHLPALRPAGKDSPGIRLFLKLDASFKDSLTVHSPRKPLTGITVAGTHLRINAKETTVYQTGAFGLMLSLQPGMNLINFQLTGPDSSKLDTSVKLNYIPMKPAVETRELKIEEVSLYPHEDQELVSGDVLKIRVKALTGCSLVFWNAVPLTELPSAQTGGMRGIYQVNYIIRPIDTLQLQKLVFTLTGKDGRKVSAKSEERIGFNSAGFPRVAITHGDLPYMNFGLGTDRLGGAKLGYLDTLVRMKVSARSGNLYRVDLSEHQQAWIPLNLVKLMPLGTFFPASNTGNITVTADSDYDYIRMTLSDRLPYSSDLLTGPTRIEINVYGASSNTNWIIQHRGTRTVQAINTHQLETDLFRIEVDLVKEQSWGYSVYYEGRSQLVIRIKHAPQVLDLKKLSIAIDAGHGGKNYGARSITGVYEKNLTLEIAGRLKANLESSGAQVVLTRNADIDLSMYDRVKELKTFRPDILISIHANSSDNPEINGNSTYYRYAGFRNLSLCIYQKVLELGLNDYGNIGRFNFGLSGPTDYPNALVETAFLSSPGDEAKILDPAFQTQLAVKIVEGINLFLKNADKKNAIFKPAAAKP